MVTETLLVNVPLDTGSYNRFNYACEMIKHNTKYLNAKNFENLTMG